MLKLIIPGSEYFNETTQEFITFDPVEVELEHSLISLSKWESKFKKPFLSTATKTNYELLAYIECMVISPTSSQNLAVRLTNDQISEVNDYIESEESATTFGTMPEVKTRGPRPETITSELIYYWLVAFNIPFEVEHWHLNRLFSLIRICNIKNSKPQKMSKAELARRNKELNEKRRKELGTSG